MRSNWFNKVILMVKSTPDEFLKMFSEFYEQFFDGFANSIETLAKLQKKFPKFYDAVKTFGNDPNSIEKILSEMDNEKRGILLNILLKAGDISRRTSMLFDSSVEEKERLAKDLKDFARVLNQNLKSKKQKR